jgi:archaetidylinositol phosphate synthase
MGLYTLKFPYRKILEPLAKKMKDVNPDILSYAALPVALFTGICIYLSPEKNSFLLLVIILTFLRMTLNTIDGVIAIEQKRTGLAGEIVNALPDRYSDIFVMLGIAFSSYCRIYIGAIAAICVLLVSYTGMLGKAIGVNWQHHGPLGKVERLILIMGVAFLQFIFTLKGYKNFSIFSFNTSIFELLMIYFILSSQMTVFNRLKGMLKEIKENINVK